MIINSSFVSRSTGLTWAITYNDEDTDSIESLPVSAASAVCFCGDKMVLVHVPKRDSWEMPGGGREPGETVKECIIREIREETNMRALELLPLGYDAFTNPETKEIIHHARFTATVEPYGPFVADPDGDISEIKLIEPRDYKKYFDWGERSDQMLKKASGIWKKTVSI